MIALIPARGGSKGVPKKNIRDFRGKPLIRWTIDAAKESDIFTNIVVSSDSFEILDYCTDVSRVKRADRLAQDDTPMDSVVADFLHGMNVEHLMLLQPTSPLRTAHDIVRARQQYWGYSLISVVKTNNKYLKGMLLEGDLLNTIYDAKRRQDLPPFYLPNGAIYLFSKQAFIENDGIPRLGVQPFVMEESLDVDTESDFRCR